jgi:hypothetical protein
VTEQFELEASTPESEQVVELKLPDPDELKVTVPVGAEAVPVFVSVTVAVQVVAWFCVTGLPQLTAVDVARLALIAKEAAVLAACVVLPP